MPDRTLKVEPSSRVRDRLRQGREVEIAKPLAQGEDPLVVELLEQLAFVDLDGLFVALGHRSCGHEFVDVEPERSRWIPVQVRTLDLEPVSRRSRRQDAR